jgi:polysaccharide export outer membrane protein
MVLALLVLGLCLQDPPAAPPPPEAAGARYRVGAEDVLRITVYGHPDLSQDVVVEPDGTFDFPLIGRIDAGERTRRELEDEIAARLARGFVRDAQVRVVIQVHRSKTVFVMGELSRPGTYPLPDGRTVVEILSRAGPLLPTAGGEVLVLRARDGASGPADAAQAEVIHIDLEKLQSGALAQNPLLQPDDTVLVPRASRVFVFGEVRSPGVYNAPSGGMTVRQAVSLAGGFAKRAARDTARILRPAEGRMTELNAKMDDAVAPGDTVVVEKKKGIF